MPKQENPSRLIEQYNELKKRVITNDLVTKENVPYLIVKYDSDRSLIHKKDLERLVHACDLRIDKGELSYQKAYLNLVIGITEKLLDTTKSSSDLTNFQQKIREILPTIPSTYLQFANLYILAKRILPKEDREVINNYLESKVENTPEEIRDFEWNIVMLTYFYLNKNNSNKEIADKCIRLIFAYFTSHQDIEKVNESIDKIIEFYRSEDFIASIPLMFVVDTLMEHYLPGEKEIKNIGAILHESVLGALTQLRFANLGKVTTDLKVESNSEYNEEQFCYDNGSICVIPYTEDQITIKNISEIVPASINLYRRIDDIELREKLRTMILETNDIVTGIRKIHANTTALIYHSCSMSEEIRTRFVDKLKSDMPEELALQEDKLRKLQDKMEDFVTVLKYKFPCSNTKQNSSLFSFFKSVTKPIDPITQFHDVYQNMFKRFFSATECGGIKNMREKFGMFDENDLGKLSFK